MRRSGDGTSGHGRPYHDSDASEDDAVIIARHRRHRAVCSEPLQLALALVTLLSVLLLVMYSTTNSLLAQANDHALRGYRRAPSTDDIMATKAPIPAAQSPFAYMFYITNDVYACAVVHFLHHLVDVVHANTSAIDIVVLHSEDVSEPVQTHIQTLYNAKMIPVETINADAAEFTWMASLTKLYAFRNWGYDRVVYVDADSVPMQNLDHLFTLPPAPLYAPRAYWLKQPFFASALMVIEPSDERFSEMVAFARNRGDAAGYDMDILNALYKDTVKYLPSEYMVLNSELRQASHEPTALSKSVTELKMQAKLIHFSCQPDGRYGKPWMAVSADLFAVRDEGFDPLFAQLFRDYWDSELTRCPVNS